MKEMSIVNVDEHKRRIFVVIIGFVNSRPNAIKHTKMIEILSRHCSYAIKILKFQNIKNQFIIITYV